MSELIHNEANKADRLRAVIDKLASGAKPSDVKKEFHELIKGADASEVAAMEQSLIESGMPVEEVQRLCEVHADVFRDGLEKGRRVQSMGGHPVHTYMAENKVARKHAGALARAALFGSADSVKAAAEALKPIIVHYTRKENQLFPFLEKSGFTGPSKVMWGKHDEVRARFKELDEAYENGDKARVKAHGRALAAQVRTMIFMEERILFPNALKRLSDADWASVRRGEDAIGFAWVKPGAEYDPALVRPAGSSMYANLEAAIASSAGGSSGAAPSLAGADGIRLSEGSLSLEVLNLILTGLPMDVSFVDANDKVQYYSDSPHRVFPRSPAIIGRDVRNCHPHKSVATVEKIIAAFKNKERDKADFWLELNGRFIFISYKPLYGKDGSYLGTLEMSMDATELRSLSGKRTLLDW